MSSTRNSKVINASPEALYRAFTSPGALAAWLAPGDMTARVHSFDLKVNGGYRMSLFYPASDKTSQGKTSEKEDSFIARFVELDPPHKVVQAITFISNDPAFAGEMVMEVNLEPKDKGTMVTILFRDIPPGIRPEDNEEGTRSSLEKLARYVEGERL